MAENTKNLELKKPSQTDFYNVDDFNNNFQKIDDFVGRKDNPHGVTAKQTGAWGISSNGMTTSATDLNEMYVSGYYQISVKCINAPVTANAGDILIIFPWDANSVLQIYSSTAKLWYRKALYSTSGTRKWGVWERLANLSEVLPISGGTLTGQLLALNNGMGRVYADGANIALTALIAPDNTSNRRTFVVSNSNSVPKLTDALYIRDVIDDASADYRIFGEHNKPTGTYTGTGTTRTVAVSGVGNALLIIDTSNSTPLMFIVTANGAVRLNSNGFYSSTIYKNGVLSLPTGTDANLNAHNYTYYVL